MSARKATPPFASFPHPAGPVDQELGGRLTERLQYPGDLLVPISEEVIRDHAMDAEGICLLAGQGLPLVLLLSTVNILSL